MLRVSDCVIHLPYHRRPNGSASEIRSTRLMLDLCERVTPIPFEAAVQMGLELAEELRPAGYIVTGGH
jgi:hypothetical protein